MTRLALVAALCLTAAPAFAQVKAQAQNAVGLEASEATAGAAGQLADLARQVSGSLVRVEFTARFDKGESPGGGRLSGVRRFIPAALRTAMSDGWESWNDLIDEERPAERGGVLISPTRVVVADPMLHPRFLKSIAVRFGDQVVGAVAAGYPTGRRYLVLELAKPLNGTSPVAFKADAPGPLYAVTYGRENGVWTTGVTALPSDVRTGSDGRSGTPCPPEALVVDRSGAGVGLTGLELLGLDGSWKGTPDSWEMVSRKEMGTLLERLAGETDRSLLRVALALRSPRGQPEGIGQFGGRFGRGDDHDGITEWNGTGLLVDPTTVLVLAGFKPKVTARLDRISVFSADGKEHQASFAGSFKDWGGFLATLDRPLEGPARPCMTPLLDQRDRLLLQAVIRVRGDAREAYFWQDRPAEFSVGVGGNTFPTMNSIAQAWSPFGQEANGTHALFAPDGSLVALQVNRRPKVTAEDGPEEPLMMPGALLGALIKDRAAHTDAENRPLGEEEENRLAWLGVELQAMNPELARANNVSDQTEGGRTGGLVAYVYPGSPGAAAGLEEGDILLRLHVQGQPKPLEVAADGTDMDGMMNNLWQDLDRIPEEYLDQMPKPWGSAETALTRALTDIGFGTPFTADVFRDGKVVSAGFTVTQGPAHYDAAKRFKSEELGLTVRDLTYEVRRYFKIKPGDPGVIISKIEKGGKAAVAGLKPFEIITGINDTPVASADDARRMTGDAVKAGGELRLEVKRMTRGRLVRIRLDTPAPDGDGNPKEDER